MKTRKNIFAVDKCLNNINLNFLGSSSDEELVPTTDRHIKLCKSNFCHFISIPPTDVYKSTKKIDVVDEVIPIKEIIIEQKPIKPKKKIKKNFASSRIRSSNGFRKLMKSSEMAWHMDNIRYILECSNATPILSKDQNGYYCCYCSKKYQNPKNLKNHTIAHKNKTDPKLKLDSKNLLSRHIVFLDVTSLDCEVCGVSIDSLENLMTHLKTDHDVDLHLEIKNHIMPLKTLNNDLNCAVCEEVVQFDDIPVHMAKHYRNYECELCSSVFVNRGMKVDHQKYVHDLELKL